MNTIQKIYHLYANRPVAVDFSGQDASDLIKAELDTDKPSLIARLGSTELQAMSWYINSKHPLKKYFEKLRGKTILKKMNILSGFFPSTQENIIKFSKMMLKDMQEVDILGSWRKEEGLFIDELKNSQKVTLKDLEPYYHKHPWSKVLQHKKVLVIHPFDKSIQNQYKKRELLFENPEILPEFELITLKAVQTIASNKSEFTDWFEALESMKNQIDKIDFDIALIGCGAYGFPLAAHVKRMGKKSVMLGGALQILFGIKGKRWDNHPEISLLINDNWSRPLPDEVPSNSIKIDGGSYW
jgi:hypothetical protein